MAEDKQDKLIEAVEKRNSNPAPVTPRPNVTPVAQDGTTSVQSDGESQEKPDEAKGE